MGNCILLPEIADLLQKVAICLTEACISSVLWKWILNSVSLRLSTLQAQYTVSIVQMFDDQDLGFCANFLGIFIFVLVIAYHYVIADPKYEGN
ncbi:hypothetical protein NC652_020516 [Populus alba x Populus x berolinensis]|nr:hypothetical protein NC652_020516 [Populus alba x Populus x berolinensis]